MRERPDWLDAAVIEDRSFRLVDVVDDPIPTISDRTFVRCTIYGPAVIVPLTSAFDTCAWTANDLDAILWELRPDATVIGAIGLKDCRFEDCRFIGIEKVADGAWFSPFDPGTWGGGPAGKA